MSNQCHYMRKGKKGPIERVNLNDWARKRKAGYEFSTEAEYLEQQAAIAEDAATDVVAPDEVPTMDNTKAEILAYADAHEIEVDPESTKSELLDIIDPQ